jgi:ferrous iron transport protein A
LTTLASLLPGARGKVTRVEGLDEVSLRLMEMGLIPGVELTVIGLAPLGDPIEVELRGYRLSLRKTEASRVEME